MPTRWVFGMVAMEFNPPRPIFYVVNNRSRPTLENIIRLHCRPGTTIHSDMWKGYYGLAALGYIHRKVNHSREFVNSDTGIV